MRGSNTSEETELPLVAAASPPAKLLEAIPALGGVPFLLKTVEKDPLPVRLERVNGKTFALLPDFTAYEIGAYLETRGSCPCGKPTCLHGQVMEALSDAPALPLPPLPAPQYEGEIGRVDAFVRGAITSDLTSLAVTEKEQFVCLRYIAQGNNRPFLCEAKVSARNVCEICTRTDQRVPCLHVELATEGVAHFSGSVFQTLLDGFASGAVSVSDVASYDGLTAKHPSNPAITAHVTSRSGQLGRTAGMTFESENRNDQGSYFTQSCHLLWAVMDTDVRGKVVGCTCHPQAPCETVTLARAMLQAAPAR